MTPTVLCSNVEKSITEQLRIAQLDKESRAEGLADIKLIRGTCVALLFYLGDENPPMARWKPSSAKIVASLPSLESMKITLMML